MNELFPTQRNDGVVKTMDSRQVAEYTGKMHKHVLDAIRTMEPAWQKINGTKFRLVEYRDAKGEMRPCYELTKRECLYIATKFDDEMRAILINRWEELETKPIDFSDPNTVLRLAQNWADERNQRMIAEQEREEYRRELKEATPKIEAYNTVLDSKGTLLTNQVAKEFGMSDKTLNAVLRDLGVQYKQRGQWLLKEKYQNKGYTDTITTSGTSQSTGRSWATNSTVWFQKGRLFIHELLTPLINGGELIFKSGSWYLKGNKVKVTRS